eukprot:5813310-Prymnesium_polylepis.1
MPHLGGKGTDFRADWRQFYTDPPTLTLTQARPLGCAGGMGKRAGDAEAVEGRVRVAMSDV